VAYSLKESQSAASVKPCPLGLAAQCTVQAVAAGENLAPLLDGRNRFEETLAFINQQNSIGNPKMYARKQNKRRFASARRGAYSVEFAICATVLFSTIFASIELARYLFVRQAIDQAAYEAARTGVIAGATAAQVRAKATQLLAAQGITVSSVSVTPSTFTATTTEIAVEITCNYAANTWVPPSFLPGTNIVTRTVLDHENQAYLVPAAAAANAAALANPEPLDV
jgi:Flp pilus assembly protein TadG